MFKALVARNCAFARLSTGSFARAFESTSAGTANSASTQAPELVTYPYFVQRTRFQSLPVYTDIKNGGTRKLTLVRRIEGDIEALRSDLVQALEDSTIQINGVSRQLVIKGDRVKEVRAWLTKKGF
ncbi:mitochondrial 54S ribosomal protein img2 [Dipsacomyces acuminosporus]|nr:mitochondrial 54S ribosomal protein img2 [Dipsacomyces acuminosporus]